MSTTSTEHAYRKSMASILKFIRKKRKEVREKKKIPPPENFVDISQINKDEYALTPKQIEFF